RGGDRSTLGPVFAAAARAESLTVDSEPDLRGAFFRSDHFPFARAGVPALSIFAGDNFVGRPKGWGTEQENIYNEQRYHQPSDEYQASFRYDGMAQEVRVTVRTAQAVARTGTPQRAARRDPALQGGSCHRSQAKGHGAVGRQSAGAQPVQSHGMERDGDRIPISPAARAGVAGRRSAVPVRRPLFISVAVAGR